MRTLLFSISIFLSFSAFSQVWGRPGATWHYSRNFITNGFITIKYTNDTVVDGHSCQKLKGTLYEFMQTNAQGDMVMLVSNEGTWYTYVSGDTVFYKTPTGFRVLYNFAAQAGDEWVHNVSTPSYNCNDTSAVKVNATETMTIDGQSLNALTIEDVANSSTTFNLGNPTKIVSRIGNIGGGFLFPFMYQACDSSIFVDHYQFSFRCYEDDQVYYNPNDLHCEYFLGLEEKKPFSMTVFPNPAKDMLIVTADPAQYTYEILSVSGKKAAYGILQGAIGISTLQSGVYLLKLTNDAGQTGIMRFIKN